MPLDIIKTIFTTLTGLNNEKIIEPMFLCFITLEVFV